MSNTVSSGKANINHVATAPSRAKLVKGAMAVEKKINNIEKSLDGYKASHYHEIPLQSNVYLQTKSTINKAISDNSNYIIIDQRVQQTESSIKRVSEILQGFTVLFTSALNNETFKETQFQIGAQTALDQIIDLLNFKLDGSGYLFSGSRTDVAPIDKNSLPSPTPMSPPDTSYYKGDSKILSYQPNTGITINYGIKADDPAFEQIIRGLLLVTSANLSKPISVADKSAINTAYQLINDAGAAVNNMYGEIGRIGQNIDANRDLSEKIRLSGLERIGEIIDTDMLLALTDYANAVTQYQAELMLIKENSKMNLVDYLR